jgi:conjugal transfer/entry exclusion protein
MSRRILFWLLILGLAVVPLRAQVVVIDPANLTQAIVIAERTLQQYDELRREYEVIQRMAQRLGGLDGYRIPPVALTVHDPARWEYGSPWVQALNSGDPGGTAYLQTAIPLGRPRASDLNRLSPTARRSFQSQYATMEITDSVAMMGAHQVALVRNFSESSRTLSKASKTTSSTLNPISPDTTAVLDKVAAGELLGRRQDAAINQLLSMRWSSCLARSKRMRDTEAGNVNMQLLMWRDGRAANQAFVRGTGDALRNWRQP